MPREVPDMFPVATRLTFSRDGWGRLRIAAPLERRPIAAWLHGDLQGNLSCQDIYLELFDKASNAPEHADRRVDGNACRVSFWDGGWVQLHSQYDRWQPLWLQFSELVDAINELRTHLLNEPVVNDDSDEGCYGGVIESTDPAETAPPTYHTFFPDVWKPEQVESAAKGAWDSDAFCADETTGAWSGISNGLEVAGYFDTVTGQVFDAYPVINR
ncbi:MAG TPA: EndoU domain-containing protein [Candidatus Dormibacteraeota bacterium]|nr:EndoU domain-containing protein [Candidatus Dormibacteraeota bacterium]